MKQVLHVGCARVRRGIFYVRGSSAEFFVGDVPGNDDAPPDFTADSDADIRAGLISWNSEFIPQWSTRFSPVQDAGLL